MAARLLRWIFNALFRLLARLHVEGMENLPGSGAYIVAANHLNFFDAPMIYGLVGGPRLSGWAAEKWERHAVYGTILKLGGGIFIQRGQVDRSALDSAVAWLRSGRVFGMAPEGTRSKTGGLIRGKSGVAYLAHQSGAPIVPLAHFGTERIGPSLLRLRRARVHVRIGKPFSLPPLDEDDRGASLRRNTDEVMCRIGALLPPAYRGVYADHPRLRELLNEAQIAPAQ